MGIGKILAYTVGGAVLGVGAIAAAPFTGGGSILGAVTLASSLAGAGAVAAGTAAVAGGTGAYLARQEDDEHEEKDNKIAGLNQKAEKVEEGFKQALERFHGDNEYFNYIIGLTAIGISMACVDGEISEDEKAEIEEFIGGVTSSSYPEHIKEVIRLLYKNKPNFQTAMVYLQKIDPRYYPDIRNLLELIMLVDNFEHDKEKAFIQAFDHYVPTIKYTPESDDSSTTYLEYSKKDHSSVLDHIVSARESHMKSV